MHSDHSSRNDGNFCIALGDQQMYVDKIAGHHAFDSMENMIDWINNLAEHAPQFQAYKLRIVLNLEFDTSSSPTLLPASTSKGVAKESATKRDKAR